MPRSSYLFARLGFEVWQVPGVSRAWRRDLADGSFILITDVGGYDLPEPGGPYTALGLSRTNEIIEVESFLKETKSLFHWLSHLQRLIKYRELTAVAIPLQPNHVEVSSPSKC